MKKIILYIGVACAVTSCGNNGANQADLIQATKTADSLKAAMAEKNTIDSMNAVSAAQKGTSGETTRTVEHRTETHTTTTTNNNNNNAPGGGAPPPPPPVTNPQPSAPAVVSAPPPPPPVAAPPAAPAKKKMDPKLEGALIGAGAGAVGGALLDSKKKGQAVKGGLLGGALGAAAGFGAGALIDHKKKKDTTGN